jgi:hypothetical protein
MSVWEGILPTAAKVPGPIAPSAKAPKRAVPARAEPVAEYRMPVEVADWIKQAEARITFLTGKVDELKADNAALKRSHKLMEQRVMGQSQE